MDFTPDEINLFREVGRTETGRQLIGVLNRAKNHYASISTIDGKGDYGAQVEGRRIFVDFVDSLIERFQLRKPRPGDVFNKDYDDFQ